MPSHSLYILRHPEPIKKYRQCSVCRSNRLYFLRDSWRIANINHAILPWIYLSAKPRISLIHQTISRDLQVLCFDFCCGTAMQLAVDFYKCGKRERFDRTRSTDTACSCSAKQTFFGSSSPHQKIGRGGIGRANLIRPYLISCSLGL
jgi:hypothetical protein